MFLVDLILWIAMVIIVALLFLLTGIINHPRWLVVAAAIMVFAWEGGFSMRGLVFGYRRRESKES